MKKITNSEILALIDDLNQYLNGNVTKLGLLESIKELQVKIAKEFELNKAIKEANLKEFDKWLNNLIMRNGTTEY